MSKTGSFAHGATKELLLSEVRVTETGCWLRERSISTKGYSRWEKKVSPWPYKWPAHRVYHEFFKGPIPEGFEPDHLCRVRHCVNPDHLELVTKKENILRGIGPAAENARKTHCPQGHAYAPANTYRSSRGERVCRTCKRARDRARELVRPKRNRKTKGLRVAQALVS